MASQSYRENDRTKQKERSVPETQGRFEDSQQDAKKRAKERVQFDFSSDALLRLDQLKKQLRASTRAEVIRLALRLLEWFSEIPEEAMITVTDKEEILAKFSVKLLYGYGSKE